MCWGYNASGQIGNSSQGTDRLVPTNVSGLTSGVSRIVAGGQHTCARLTSGGVKCWGNNSVGQVGNGLTGGVQLAPVDVSTLTSNVSQITVGGGHACALLSSGGLRCWGWNIHGVLGIGSTASSSLPVGVYGLSSGVTSVAAGGLHTCARLNSGRVRCWGSNDSGQLGDNSFSIDRLTPVEVVENSGTFVPLAEVQQVTAGGNHSCGLVSPGVAKCWGANNYGQVGDGTQGIDRLAPFNVGSIGELVTQITAGTDHTCARLHSGATKCWGNNRSGAVGDGTSSEKLVPTDVIQDQQQSL